MPVADRLVVAGAATGSTAILLNATGQPTLGVPVVLVQAGAGSQAGAFTVAGIASNGQLDTTLVFNAGALTYGLVTTPGAAVFRTLKLSEGTQQLAYRVSDAWSSHMAELRDSRWGDAAGVSRGRIWGQISGAAASRAEGTAFTSFGLTTSADLSYRLDSYGGQMGIDLHPRGEDSAITLGLTGGYLNSALAYFAAADNARIDSFNLGAYAGFAAGPLFVNALARYDRHTLRFYGETAGYRARLHGSSYGATIEAGARFGSPALFAEPSASLQYVRTDLGRLDALGSSTAFDDLEGLRGRLGLKVGGGHDIAHGARLTVYAGGAYVHEFEGKDGIRFTSGTTTIAYRNRPIGDFGEGKAGLSIRSAGGVTGFIEGFGVRGNGYKGGGGRAGLRLAL